MNVNELPQYKCHKVVRAGRIHSCIGGVLSVQVGNTKAIVEFDVGREWVTKHRPERDGYFVVYEDGYQSYSPAAAFEAGYHLVETGTACGGTPATTADEPLTTDMPPHQLRVLEELADLSVKLEKLTAFFDTELYRSLDATERNLLKEQSLFMQEYQRVLAERVAAFQ